MTWAWLIHHLDNIGSCDGFRETDTVYFLTGKGSQDDQDIQGALNAVSWAPTKNMSAADRLKVLCKI